MMKFKDGKHSAAGVSIAARALARKSLGSAPWDALLWRKKNHEWPTYDSQGNEAGEHVTFARYVSENNLRSKEKARTYTVHAAGQALLIKALNSSKLNFCKDVLYTACLFEHKGGEGLCLEMNACWRWLTGKRREGEAAPRWIRGFNNSGLSTQGSL